MPKIENFYICQCEDKTCQAIFALANELNEVLDLEDNLNVQFKALVELLFQLLDEACRKDPKLDNLRLRLNLVALISDRASNAPERTPNV
jgi:succinylglutamate desuccinylase